MLTKVSTNRLMLLVCKLCYSD